MQLQDLMTAQPAFCTPDTPLQQVAAMMIEFDCGCIPVLENAETLRPLGVVTDRDICCRTVAVNMNPLEMTAIEVMSGPALTLSLEHSLEDCQRVMEKYQVRRLVILDEEGRCTGIVAQADLALDAPQEVTAEVVRTISQPAHAAVVTPH